MKAIVVLSGGMDSAVCLAWAMERFSHVSTVSFDYGQRHIKEVEAAKAMVEHLNVPHFQVALKCFDNSPSALVRSDKDVSTIDSKNGLPASFVPGRNLVFLTQAAAMAVAMDANALVTGVCQTDFSGYPDCRQRTISMLEDALSLGIDQPITIHTPLMYMTKAETVRLMERLQSGRELVAMSWTCYEGGPTPCSKCPSCVLRAKGFEEAGVPDPALP